MNLSILRNRYYLLRYQLRCRYWNYKSKKSTINGVILMYHHISDEKLDEIDSCQHTLKQLIDGIEYVKSHGYKIIPINVAYKYIREKSDEKFAVITFDDVPQDALINGLPFLIDNNIPFTLFITTGFIGNPEYLSKGQLISLDKSELCTIGAHTMTHPMLRYSTRPESEIVGSKKLLENILGHTIDFFAYPYGQQSSVSRKVRRMVREAGFKCAFGTIQAHVSDSSSKDIFYLPRRVIKLI